MSIREIITEENPMLRQVSQRVTAYDEKLWMLLNDMRETLMSSENGVGLSAVQIGELKRVIIFMIDKDNILEFVNPSLHFRRGKQQLREGCLSVPGKYGMTERPAKVTISGHDRSGKTISYTLKGFFAAEACHEVDHLDGILFTDRLIPGETLKTEDEIAEEK